MPHEDDLRGFARYRAAIFLLIGMLLLSIPMAFKAVEEHHYHQEAIAHPTVMWWLIELAELIGKIGDACVIAVLIGIVVDKGLKLKLIEEVAKAASPKLWLQHVPASLQDGIADFVKHISFVRPDWTVEYTLTPLAQFPDMLQVTSRITGTVLNCRGADVSYTFIGGVDPSSIGESLITRVSMSPEFGASLFDTTPDNQEILQPDGTRLFSYPTMLMAGQRYKTVLETIEFRPTSYVLPLFTSTTVASAIVRIRFPKDRLSVQVYTALDPALPPQDTGWGQEWEVKKSILPGQCIVASWLPLQKKTPAQPPLAASIGQAANQEDVIPRQAEAKNQQVSGLLHAVHSEDAETA